MYLFFRGDTFFRAWPARFCSHVVLVRNPLSVVPQVTLRAGSTDFSDDACCVYDLGTPSTARLVGEWALCWGIDVDVSLAPHNRQKSAIEGG